MTTTTMLMTFRSPCCHDWLAENGAVLTCARCQASYRSESYGPDLMPAELAEQPEFSTWQSVQHALREWRKRTWNGSSAATTKTNQIGEMANRFLDLAKPRGLVLDVGCGSGWIETLFRARGCDYIGIDPQPLCESYPFPFARAMSDRMPLADAAVSACLFFSSLDYSLSAVDTLREARRVLSPGGRLLIATPVHRTKEVSGERLHHHRFVDGELNALVSDVFGRTPESDRVSENYHLLWTVR